MTNWKERETNPREIQKILAEAHRAISDQELNDKLSDVSYYIQFLGEKNFEKKLIIGGLGLVILFFGWTYIWHPVIQECSHPYANCTFW